MPAEDTPDVKALKATIEQYLKCRERAYKARGRHTSNLLSGESNSTETRWSGRNTFSASMMLNAARSSVKNAFRDLTSPDCQEYWRKELKEMGIEV